MTWTPPGSLIKRGTRVRLHDSQQVGTVRSIWRSPNMSGGFDRWAVVIEDDGTGLSHICSSLTPLSHS